MTRTFKVLFHKLTDVDRYLSLAICRLPHPKEHIFVDGKLIEGHAVTLQYVLRDQAFYLLGLHLGTHKQKGDPSQPEALLLTRRETMHSPTREERELALATATGILPKPKQRLDDFSADRSLQHAETCRLLRVRTKPFAPKTPVLLLIP